MVLSSKVAATALRIPASFAIAVLTSSILASRAGALGAALFTDSQNSRVAGRHVSSQWELFPTTSYHQSISV